MTLRVRSIQSGTRLRFLSFRLGASLVFSTQKTQIFGPHLLRAFARYLRMESVALVGRASRRRATARSEYESRSSRATRSRRMIVAS